MWHYASVEDAIDDALRLSRAMTLKAAVAGLELGGGKAVIALPAGAAPPREELLHDFADTINALAGSYITAEDVGTTIADMATLSGFTDYVVGRPGGSGDPSDFTAAGVEASMRAVCRRLFGTRELRDRRVAIVGCGSVGAHLARRLHAAGAALVLADVREGKRALADELGARWATPMEALLADVEILAPCALGGVIDAELAGALRCRAICGAANNQLTDGAVADVLAARDVLYAPDFLVNAGGLINVSLELVGYDRELATRRAAELEQVLGGVLEHAEQQGITPLAAARELAERRLS
jgi:leucine dehydrogenase